MNKILRKATPLITAVLLLTLLAAPVFAQEAGKLWFYSVDPEAALGYPPLPNPQTWPDPNYYVGDGSDDWLDESVVAMEGDWDSPFDLWIGLHQGTMSYDTTLVISINNDAASVITSITVTPDGEAPQVILIGAFSNVDPTGPTYPLAKHGVFGSAEWAGYAEVVVGDIASETALKITIDIALGGAVPEGARIHFDAYGWSDEGEIGEVKADITCPYSHDYTFVIPEVATILLAGASFAGFGLYAIRRKRK